MRQLAYFRPFGAGMGPVRYLLVPVGFRRRAWLETIMENGAPSGQLLVHPAQVLWISPAVRRVLTSTLRSAAAAAGYAVPADLETQTTSEVKP